MQDYPLASSSWPLLVSCRQIQILFDKTGEISKTGRSSGGLPYRVNRGLIFCEIKIGQGASANRTHVGGTERSRTRRRGCQRAAVEVEYLGKRGPLTVDVMESE